MSQVPQLEEPWAFFQTGGPCFKEPLCYQRKQALLWCGGKRISGTLTYSQEFSATVQGLLKCRAMVHSRRGRERAGQRAALPPRSLFIFLILPWVWEGAGFLSDYPVSFQDFPGCVHVPYPMSLLGFLGPLPCAFCYGSFSQVFPRFAFSLSCSPLWPPQSMNLVKETPLLNQAYQIPGSAGFLPFC